MEIPAPKPEPITDVSTMPELDPSSIEQIEAINEWFKAFEPDADIQRRGFRIMSLISQTEVLNPFGVDLDKIAEGYEQGQRFIVSPNHQSLMDTPAVASLPRRIPELAFLEGTTDIPAKAEVFGMPVIGKYLPHMRPHAVFQGRDFPRTEEGQKLRQQHGDLVVQYDIDSLDSGLNIATFSEKTRNKGNTRTLQNIGRGIGEIAVGVEHPEDTVILPVGFAFKIDRALLSNEKLLRKLGLKNEMLVRLGAIAVIGEPFSPAGMDSDQVRQENATRLQAAVDVAFEHRDKGLHLPARIAA